MGYFNYAPYVSVAQRRVEAAREVTKRARKGEILAPVRVEGRLVSRTVWGKAWCHHLETHADVSNRVPRGLRYVRNGSVIDLKILPGQVRALVSGSSIYTVTITVEPLSAGRWQAIASACAGHIDSIVELLQGRLDQAVMSRLCDPNEGVFPRSRQMKFGCSCPDGASMCKHVAAALYGVGHRLDTQPELLFILRQVDQSALVPHVGKLATAAPDSPILDEDGLGDLFGLEFEAGPAPAPALAPAPAPAPEKTRGVRQEVLEFLAESPELEFPLDDLYTYQAAKPKRSRKALRAALDALVTEGRAVVSDVDDGVTYWRIAP